MTYRFVSSLMSHSAHTLRVLVTFYSYPFSLAEIKIFMHIYERRKLSLINVSKVGPIEKLHMHMSYHQKEDIIIYGLDFQRFVFPE